MSQTQTVGQYQFEIQIQNGTAMGGTSFAIDDTWGMTDAMAVSLLNEIEQLGWPSGASVNVTVTKVATTTVNYNTDTGTTPPSFD